MPKISLAGFKDPVRRPRYIIWTGVVIIALVAVTITALGVTSTYWFCANGCHKVQDDTITAYDSGSHNQISCMACHMPVNAGPVTFLLHKVEALGEAYLTVTNKFEFPLNEGSHLALSEHMPTEQCTQCHNLANREVTPSEGIIIDHEAHMDRDIACTWCHNRVAHPENFELALTHPATGEPNEKHDDFMEMTACFRCHSQEDDGVAPGQCNKCHPPDFELKPPSHKEDGFFPRGHADLALEDMGLAPEGEEGVEGASNEGTAAEPAESAESHEESSEEHAEDLGPVPDENGSFEGLGLALPKVEDVSYCGTCHKVDVFCMNCHGMEMPHPTEFKEKKHPEVAATAYDKCVMCHNPDETKFCDSCHHGEKVAWEFDKAEPWHTQHAKSVSQNGVAGCLETCHKIEFCNDCHTKENPFPSSHQQSDWLHRASFEERAKHPEAYNTEPEACAVCHGEGGVDAQFCKDCHQFEVPHSDEFKERHAATGRANETQCAFCHKFGPLCSTCHHFGVQTDFKQAHPDVVKERGTDECFELCHEKQFCVDCHTQLSAKPTSHQQANFVQLFGDDKALHTVAYDESAESCTYCHGDGGPRATFCMSCHGLLMPHPDGFGAEDDGGIHQEKFAAGEFSKDTCLNCHRQTKCDGCHHEKSEPGREWRHQHPEIVKADGAEPCFECHEATFCAHCHVRELSAAER
ncbi:MAG: hypothetical protein Kow0056_16970 [Coriobacteriia bacterium]